MLYFKQGWQHCPILSCTEVFIARACSQYACSFAIYLDKNLPSTSPSILLCIIKNQSYVCIKNSLDFNQELTELADSLKFELLTDLDSIMLKTPLASSCFEARMGAENVCWYNRTVQKLPKPYLDQFLQSSGGECQLPHHPLLFGLQQSVDFAYSSVLVSGTPTFLVVHLGNDLRP